MTTLLGLAYSPWTQRARWALDHHGVPYDFETYAPIVGEPGLRRRLGRLKGRVSVPVLFVDGQPLEDSVAIARWAEARGRGEPLFFDDDAVTHWVSIAERGLSAGRARAAEATKADPEAQKEAVAFLAPAPFHGALRPVARFGAWMLARKYGAPPPLELERSLEALREGLGDGRHLLGGRLSFADLAMAGMLEFVAPGEHIRRGVAEKRVWGDARHANRFADLVAWRDALIRDHWKR
ncbi:MAG: glutathione S-transferase [Sandaracinus sp.]|nr:glutathione S-transferase [Sandaracinus sp.]